MFRKIVSSLLVFSTLIINFGFFNPSKVNAASLTALSDTVSNLTAGALANHTIKFTTPTGIGASKTIILTFNNGTNLGSVAVGDVDIHDGTGDVTLAAGPTTTTWGVAQTSSTVLTITSGSSTSVASNAIITIKIGTNATGGVNRITNGSIGTTTLAITGTFTDTGSIAMAIVENGVVAVSAEVLTSISFAISDPTIFFGNLSSSTNCFASGTDPLGSCATIAPGAFTMTAGTNASTGYTMSVQGDTLKSGATNTITAIGATPTAPGTGSEKFGLNLVKSGGTGAVATPYATPGSYAWEATASTPATIASTGTVSDTATYTANYLANITALTEAGSYTTAHTYVATGNF